MDKTQIALTLDGFAQIFRQKGEFDEALETLEESYSILKSQRNNEVRSSRARFALFAAIAAEFAHGGKAERSIEIAQEIDDETEKTSALAQIAQICAAQGKDVLTQSVISAISEDAQKMFALINVSDAQKRGQKTDEAIKNLNEAAHLAETVPQLSLHSQALVELAKRFAEYGDFEKARALSLENLQIIAQIRDETTRSVALARSSEVYETANFELNDAEKAILQLLIRRSAS